ncbi:MAG: biotin--[acetyl-CoA-carboxylase] ligase [Brumimicrobium sp.]|nr:biotin--[acetyl-CoA-carboxylase] ligase [Brumimicrobium sp.]
MPEAFIGHKIIHLESVDSTNNYAANLFKEGLIESGTVIMADRQLNGRGQRQNMWQSGAFENITMSIAFDPKLWKINNLISLNHITALATYHFLRHYIKDINIKWPNDLMVHNRKIAGLLIESQWSAETLQTVIGIGININQDQFDNLKATSLFLESGKRNQPKLLIYEFIREFNALMHIFLKEGAENIHERFDAVLWKKGQIQRFIEVSSSAEFKGKIIRTDPRGRLLVEVDNQIKKFGNGEIRYITD